MHGMTCYHIVEQESSVTHIHTRAPVSPLLLAPGLLRRRHASVQQGSSGQQRLLLFPQSRFHVMAAFLLCVCVGECQDTREGQR